MKVVYYLMKVKKVKRLLAEVILFTKKALHGNPYSA